MSNRAARAGTVREIRATVTEYFEIVVDLSVGDEHEQLAFPVLAEIARRYRIGDAVSIVLYKRSAR